MGTKASLLLLALPLAACGGDGRGYTQVALEVAADAPSAPNQHGYIVTLTRAEASIGPVYFFEGEPLFARVRRQALGLLIGTAYAHPGHYQEGAAVAELLDPRVVDLMAGDAAALGTADGVTGAYNSAELTFGPSADLDGVAIRVAGTAEKDGQTIAFSGSLTDTITIEGITFGATVGTNTAKVRASIDLGAWLERADFGALGADGVLTPGDQPHNALSRGVDNTSSIRFELIEP
ncbi:MAG: hypothetical protein KC933_31640 [Myxococcales bacterium]|nr:hypothetical protein [Myxococcales bacterium]MCB9646579.1 hypothetical protein [Deltaproteobacteria bacterium]